MPAAQGGNIPPTQTIQRDEAPWGDHPGHRGSAPTEAQHPPRLSTHCPASELAPTGQRREGAGGRLGEAPCCCCQAFPFKARARSGYSPFPPVLTTNPLLSSSLPGPGAPVPSGTAPGVGERQPGHGVPAPRGDLGAGGGQVRHPNAHLRPLSHPRCLLCAGLLPFLTLPVILLLLLVPSFLLYPSSPEKHHLPAQNHSCTLEARFLRRGAGWPVPESTFPISTSRGPV